MEDERRQGVTGGVRVDGCGMKGSRRKGKGYGSREEGSMRRGSEVGRAGGGRLHEKSNALAYIYFYVSM